MKSLAFVSLAAICVGSLAGCAADTSGAEANETEAHAETSEALTGYGVDVECKATNQFGYIASASGTLAIGARGATGGFVVSGNLKINTKMFGSADHKRTVAVSGSLDSNGEYAFVDLKSGANDLSGMTLAFDPNATSSIDAKDSTMYQMDCSKSVRNIPKGSDLALDHTMRFYRLYDSGGSITGARVQIDVLNIGNVAAKGTTGRVNVAGHQVSGVLYQYFGGTATAANTVNPGEHGYILATLPAGLINRCGNYAVTIDLDHTMQAGTPAPFGNDSGNVATPCLRWNTPITEFALQATPEPILQYLTIGDIVSSNVVARESDHKTCNQCHSAASGQSHPYIAPNGTLTPTQLIGGESWALGWGQTFVTQTAAKPQYLRDLFKLWVQDGAK